MLKNEIENLINYPEENDNFLEYSFNKSIAFSENLYRSHLLPRSCNKKIVDESFIEFYQSYELIPIQEAIYLCKMLIFALNTKKFVLTTNLLINARKNLRVINAILNGIELGSYKFSDCNHLLCLRYNTSYGFTKKHNIGRLYSKKASINQISKEFRYHLFNRIYRDIDIINAHPTILYKYSKERGFDTPALNLLVNNRAQFYQFVYKDYNESIPLESMKKLTIGCLNKSKTIYKSNYLTMLSTEMVGIRNSIYEEFYLSNESFRAAIDFRMEIEKTTDHSKLLQKTQSLYCFDIETKTIMKFKKLLLERYNNTEISIVPFFDGLFVENITNTIYDKSTFSQKRKYPSLTSIIQEFNEQSFIKLHLKEFGQNPKLFSNSQYNELRNAIIYIDNLSYNDTRKLLEKYKISIDMSSILEDMLKNITVKTEFSFSYDEIGSIKSHINKKYAKLLSCILEDKDLLLK